jgi:hypothetical protein
MNCGFHDDKKFSTLQVCRNPSLGLSTKVGAYKSAGQKWTRESYVMLPRMQESVKEWIPTLPNELSLWELKSQWIFESLEGDHRGQNPLDWEIFYIIGKLMSVTAKNGFAWPI